MVALALAALAVQLTGPAPVLSPRDAPRVVAMVSYRGDGYAQNVVVDVHVSGAARISPQRGTYCARVDATTLRCPGLPVHAGASNPFSFLLTQLRPGTLRVDVTARSTQGSARARLHRPVRR